MKKKQKKKVVVVGGGFAGVETAIHLDKKLFEVHLLSERSFLYMYPLAIWVPTGKKNINEISLPLAQIARKHYFHFSQEKVINMKTDKKEVYCESGLQFSYDYLVLAHGSTKWKISGVEKVFTVCDTPTKAESLHKHYQELLQKKQGHIAIGFGGNPKDPSAVRGGPAFEILFNIDNDLRKRGLRENFKLTFFAPMVDPGKRMGQKALANVGGFSQKAGIERKVGKKILGFDGQKVLLQDAESIDADLSIFVSTLTGSPLSLSSGLPVTAAGFLKADSGGKIEGQEYVFGAGDSIDFEGPAWKAKQGHLAEVQAVTVAANIKAHALGKPLRHSFKDKVSIICLMDFGKTGAFIFRGQKKEFSLYLSWLGHFLKWGWGLYFKAVKYKWFFKIPGL